MTLNYKKTNRIDEMKKLLLPIGLPASGKTTLRKTSYKHYSVVSPDEIRLEVLDFSNTGKRFDADKEEEVWKRVWIKYDRLLSEKADIFFDATNTTFKRRYQIVTRARKAGYFIKFFYIKVTLQSVLVRNARRKAFVPEQVIARMFVELDEPESWEYDKLILYTRPFVAD